MTNVLKVAVTVAAVVGVALGSYCVASAANGSGASSGSSLAATTTLPQPP